MRIPQAPESLLNHLKEQISFLCRSSKSFDDGYEDEGKRLAHTMRVLLHNTPKSHALLAQQGLLENIMYRDTAIPIENNSSGQMHCLARLVISNASAKSEAPLDNLSPVFGNRLIKFCDWWNQVVIRDSNGNLFSRRDLILKVANTDGGSHVDPALDPQYAALTRENSMQWWITEGDTHTPFGAPHLPSIRQISHELLGTIAHAYPEAFVDSDYLAKYRQVNFCMIPLDCDTPGRNEPCPCGSGLKFKKCHYMIQSQRTTPPPAVENVTHSYTPTSVNVIMQTAE